MADEKDRMEWQEGDLQLVHAPFKNVAQYAEGDAEMAEPAEHRPPSLDGQAETVERGEQALKEYLVKKAEGVGNADAEER